VIVPDTNLLLYAEIDAFPHHRPARQWWEELLSSEHLVGLCSPVLFGFLRISTHRRVLTEPLAIDDALGRVRGWLNQPNVTHLVPGTRHLDVAFGLLESLGTAADLTTDVQVAAHAIEHRGEVHSNDRDFGRFPGLKWVDPLASAKPSRRR
jgi:toxin-antitoxin system PIN domain toxin